MDEDRKYYHRRLRDASAPAILSCDGFFYHCKVEKGYRYIGSKRVVTLYFTDVDTGRYVGEYWALRKSPYWTITFKNDDEKYRSDFGDS